MNERAPEYSVLPNTRAGFFWGKEILKHPETCLKAIEECILEKQIAACDVVDLEDDVESSMSD